MARAVMRSNPDRSRLPAGFLRHHAATVVVAFAWQARHRRVHQAQTAAAGDAAGGEMESVEHVRFHFSRDGGCGLAQAAPAAGA